MVTATAPELPFDMVRQMSRLMDQVQKGYSNFYPSETWTPAVNLYENEQTYVVCVDLAGVNKEQIDIEVQGHSLVLRGRRAVPLHSEEETQPPPQPERMRVHLMEIDHGPFLREVELPLDVVQEGITATYRNGLLWIELPKK